LNAKKNSLEANLQTEIDDIVKRPAHREQGLLARATLVFASRRSREKSRQIKENQRNQTIKEFKQIKQSNVCPRGGKRLGAGRKPIAVKSIAAKAAKVSAAQTRAPAAQEIKENTSAKLGCKTETDSAAFGPGPKG
jgi:recombination DNA repair RAD52 pathway protein